MSGAVSYHAGLAAEGAVERRYGALGAVVAARRWRGAAGEIDMILRLDGALVFVEVKKSRTHARAAERLSRRQMQRIFAAAEEYMAGEPTGLSTEARFDVALVDETGQITVIENVFLD